MPVRGAPRALALAFAAAVLVAEARAVARPPALDVVDLDLLPRPRIVGGVPVASPAYSFMVSLSAGDAHQCGGILVSPSCVLSAAHCVERLPLAAGAVRAVVGARALPDCGLPGGTFETIAARPARHVHPEYSFAADGTTLPVADLAVVQLARPASPRFPPAVLNLKDAGFPAGGRATAVGFGFTAFDAGAASCELNRVVSALRASGPGGAPGRARPRPALTANLPTRDAGRTSRSSRRRSARRRTPGKGTGPRSTCARGAQGRIRASETAAGRCSGPAR